MAATVAVVVAGLLILGSVSTAAPKQRLTAERVQRLIDSEGARGAIEQLFDSGELENALLEGIGTGGAGWLRVAAQLERVSDGGAGEGLVDAVQEALPKNPTGVLRLVRDGTFPAKHACGGYGFGQYEDERPTRELLRLVDMRIRAVSAVRTSRLAREREACLGELVEAPPAAQRQR